MNLFYEACRPVMRGLLWALTDFRAEDFERVPRHGPLIVASNHLHFCDPPLLGGVLPRYVRFMAKREAFKFPWGWLFANAYGAFPVRRNELDRAAIRQAERVLQDGGVLGMFPEGHRSHGLGLLPAFDGVALIARRTGVAILPVGIAGTETVFKAKPRWRVIVRVGEPFRARSGCPLGDVTDDLMHRIAELLPERYRGSYGSGEPGSVRRTQRSVLERSG